MMVAMTLVVVDLGDLRHCFVLSACFPLLARPRGRDGQGRAGTGAQPFLRLGSLFRGLETDENEGSRGPKFVCLVWLFLLPSHALKHSSTRHWGRDGWTDYGVLTSTTPYLDALIVCAVLERRLRPRNHVSTGIRGLSGAARR